MVMDPVMKEKDRKKIFFKYRRRFLLLIAAVFLTGILAGGLLAKYRSDNQKQAEMIASQFHVSSDYLEENGATYEITDWQDGFDIQLYNYEKENVALISEDDITYTVQLSDNSKWLCHDQKKGKITKSTEKTSQKIRITPQAGAAEGDKVTVTVHITEPFTKTLSATFTMKGKNEPEYSLTDQENGTVLLTVQSNGYNGDITIKWNENKYAPDNTNILMESWTGSSHALTVQKNTTYTLLFFKKSADSINESKGSGTTISLS